MAEEEAKTEEVQEEEIKPGRPLKFETVEALQQKIDEYFGDCDPHVSKQQVRVAKQDGSHYWKEEEYMTTQQPYTMHGLARALDTTRETLNDYAKGKHDGKDIEAKEDQDFSDTIRRAKAKVAEYAETMLYTPANGGAKFNLTNNFGWVDRKDITSGDEPLKGGLFGDDVLKVEIIDANHPDEPKAGDSVETA